jgi:hypothetical protein
MRDEFAFDLSDFAKYGLLRALAGAGRDRAFRLGVSWYLTRDEGRNAGRRIDYLSVARPNPYSRADPYLYGRMFGAVRDPGRAVRHVQAAGILPARTAFYPEPLSFPGLSPRPVAGRLRHRDAWLEGAVRTTAGCDLVFLDPDNGLAPPAVGRHTDAASRYAYLDEVRAFVERDKAVVVIQFLGRTAPYIEQIRQRLSEVEGAMPAGTPAPLAVWWRHRLSLAFLIIPATPGQAEILHGRLQTMFDSPWGRFWGPPVTLQSKEPVRREPLTTSRPQIRPTP